MDKIDEEMEELLAFEVSAKSLWEFMLITSDSKLKRIIWQARNKSRVDINIAGKNFDYYRTCLNILKWLNPRLTEQMLMEAFENLGKYCVANKLVRHKAMKVRNGNVVKEEVVEPDREVYYDEDY